MYGIELNDWQGGSSGLFLPPQGLGIKGRWHDAKVWTNEQHRADFVAGLTKIGPIFEQDFDNGITDEGIHYLLNGGFRGVATISTWFAGLIDNAGFTGVNNSDVMSSHSGWTEATQYDESVRQTLAYAAAAARAITAAVSFTMNATKTIQGIFSPSNSTKSGTTGTLWSTALFTTPPALVSGNVLTANYTLSD